MTPDASDVAEQLIATLRQELAAARDSRKRLMGLARAYKQIALNLGWRTRTWESSYRDCGERADKAEVALAAALQREQQMRSALSEWLVWTHVTPIGQYPMDVRTMTEQALGYKSDALAAPADAQGAPLVL